MSVGNSKAPACSKGPADAVASDSSDSEGDDNGPIKNSSFDAAVLDTSVESMTVLREWNQVVRNSNVLASLSQQVEPSASSAISPEMQATTRQQQEALGEAAISLGRLAQKDVRAALKAWESAEETTTESCRTIVLYTPNTNCNKQTQTLLAFPTVCCTVAYNVFNYNCAHEDIQNISHASLLHHHSVHALLFAVSPVF